MTIIIAHKLHNILVVRILRRAIGLAVMPCSNETTTGTVVRQAMGQLRGQFATILRIAQLALAATILHVI